MVIIYAGVTLGSIGLLCGLLLAVASKYLSVEVDTRVEQICEVLPNANCGGCGYAGCGAYATAVVEENAPVNACMAGGFEVSKKIGEIMGVKSTKTIPMVATVLCAGTCDSATYKYEYEGITDCNAVARLGGGNKACNFACLGFGNCVKACRFDAISVENGVAVVDSNKCTGCGMCKEACPKKVIELLPKTVKYYVACSSHDKGVEMKGKCSAGCIGCKICEKNCKSEAITVIDNSAQIDYKKCTNCGVCMEKCPRKIIKERIYVNAK